MPVVQLFFLHTQRDHIDTHLPHMAEVGAKVLGKQRVIMRRVVIAVEQHGADCPEQGPAEFHHR